MISQNTKKTKKPFKSLFLRQLHNSLLVILTLTTILGFGTSYLLFRQNSSNITGQNIALNKEIISLIEKDGLSNLPDKNKLGEWQAKGLVESLNDPYSSYLPDEEAKKLENSINQLYEGIGVRFSNTSENLLVSYVFKNSPAEKAGLQKNDILIQVNGDDIKGKVLDDVVSQIRGPEGSLVEITILRNNQTLKFTITRQKVSSDLIYLSFEKDTAIIEITSFGQNLNAKMQDIVQQIKQKSEVKKIVLDLQNNGGGLLNESISVASYFLPEGSDVVIEKYKNSEEILKTESKNPNLQNYPITVLINKNTASASEIVASSLRDNRGSKLVGQKSFGKGVVQRIYQLQNGGQLKLTVAEWLSPKRNTINKVGLEPDIKVDLDKDSLPIAIEKGF